MGNWGREGDEVGMDREASSKKKVPRQERKGRQGHARGTAKREMEKCQRRERGGGGEDLLHDNVLN